ncbi:DUF6456 domain-containing protein [Pseudooceanicola aestuarii]|uniref:DUF6456 domain-containing protein n=1 Tax=Pseudooceanicola aestuarii TaxID=2697319 RepID=UPI0013D2F4B6|nr:DUF6456 domain-containing protein [Pseudooceanicola aestuarii]
MTAHATRTRPCTGPNPPPRLVTDDLPDPDLQEILQMLCEPATCLALAFDMERAVLVRSDAQGQPERRAVVDRQQVHRLADAGWIHCATPGRIMRYTITAVGRTARDEIAENSAKPQSPLTSGADAAGRAARGYRCDTPVTALGRRRDRDGARFLSPPQLRAAERLREDFELARMTAGTQIDWAEIPDRPIPDTAIGPALRDPQTRVRAALAELGPGLGDVALMCCCHLTGLEEVEKTLGWSARSAKIVLRIALERLRRFYDDQPRDCGLIG